MTNAVLTTAHECGRYIWARNPYVRMIAVSGSLTRPEHDASHDDADYFVIAQRGRVWEAFFGCLFHGWRYARRRGIPRKFFCFNYLVDESNLEEIDLSRREYVVEFLRLDPVAGHRVYLDLLDRLRPRLEGPEPELYRQARQRAVEAIRIEAEREPVLSRPGASVAAWRLFYRAGKLPFMALARLMEGRRKRSYPGGHIYSNRRVIRSHFRRGWGPARSDPDAMPVSRAFTALAATYDEKVVASPANHHMRSAVWQTLAPLVRPGTRVLDLGCGTGMDSAWLAQRGASVVAVDVAPGMVEATRRRVADAGMTDRVVVQRVAIETLADMLPMHARRFDIVLANFGALNMAGDPDRWCPVVARLLKPDGRLVATVMNRVSVWELVAGISRLRLSYALRRLHGDPVEVGGVNLSIHLYSPGNFVRSLKQYFRAERVSGLCSFVPPPDLERFGRGIRGEWRLLAWLDRTFGRLPGIRAAGDHFLVVLGAKQAQAPIFDRGGFGSVTAAPVVADINGDGAPEILIAARRMHVVNIHGRHLPGWPRRIGGPLASTPAVAGAGPEATVFVGSDDHRLYAIGLDGKARDGFPIRTGGDVFSSPLTHLPDRVFFGSDDGRIYAVERSGNPAPGWPFETGGFVSASPVQLRVGGETAIAIGSWDGNLYVLDRDGRNLPGWPANLDSAIWSSGAVADIDGDGHPEVVVATDRLFVLRPDATPLTGFPASLDAYAVGSPAIGDIDLDGRLEIVVASDRVYAFRDDGRIVDGFPVEIGAYVWASPILVDVDGDGHPEIVVCDFKGRLWAITHGGGVVDGYPKRLGNRIAAAPTAADVDGDGFLELIVATSDGRLIGLATECPDNLNQAPWPSFLAGRRTFHRPALSRKTPAHLGNGSSISGNGSSMTDNGSSATAERLSNPPVRSVVPIDGHLKRQVSVRGRPYGVSEVSLALSVGTRATGMLYYLVDGRMHPSPLLKNGDRHMSLIQPLPLLKAVTFSLRLRVDGNEMRVPPRGVYRFRAGVPGLSLDAGTESLQ